MLTLKEVFETLEELHRTGCLVMIRQPREPMKIRIEDVWVHLPDGSFSRLRSTIGYNATENVYVRVKPYQEMIAEREGKQKLGVYYVDA